MDIDREDFRDAAFRGQQPHKTGSNSRPVFIQGRFRCIESAVGRTGLVITSRQCWRSIVGSGTNAGQSRGSWCLINRRRLTTHLIRMWIRSKTLTDKPCVGSSG